MIKCIVKISNRNLYKLDKIGAKGLASNGYRQDFQFCLTKAIEEFIKKYEIKK